MTNQTKTLMANNSLIFFHTSDFIISTISLNKDLIAFSKAITKLYFYGAGCSSEKMNNVVLSALKSLFPNAYSTVDHDLWLVLLQLMKEFRLFHVF